MVSGLFCKIIIQPRIIFCTFISEDYSICTYVRKKNPANAHDKAWNIHIFVNNVYNENSHEASDIIVRVFDIAQLFILRVFIS